ncbi:MAG: preprotein translocase subunit SecG [Acetobacteraceae bacterium]|nr:preprotein translocase subunit SecG [Acetobacteraceae bacterium]
MAEVLLVAHLIVTTALIGVVLIQKSEGGGLGIGGGGGGGFMTGRGTANLLTRATAVLATLFMALSLTLAVLNMGSRAPSSLLESPPTAPALPATPAPPAAPAGPAVPLN